ncbi:IS256-like element ISAzba8 family transposase [Azospirillum baldaniorum]|uniref:Mutator family transposase n=2 Tax=Azospirillum baldaniorum TaxID=1064539 RepID=A0A9P1JXW4_9PROT|nr:IS256-like element ISAzba8 family transposase [Azospirillum baldaniorum]CCD01873.1 transposase of ISAzba8, IS256 family [Azospirillum baldaniorum]
MARRKEPVIPDAILDQLLAGADAKTAFDPNGLLDQLKKALTERALKAELDHHLAGDESGNRRNGYGRKTVLTERGSMDLSIPRDRTGTFDPALIAKYQRRFPGFDEKIISMYARGMSTREITGHLRELYGIEVSADLISTVTDAVIEEVTTWQNRPLEAIYPLVFLEALRSRSGEKGWWANKAIQVAIGVRADAPKKVLGLWIEQTEGAKFWLRVLNELRNRGVEDILLAVVDGLKGFPEAIAAAYPETIVQTCIVHLLRHSMEFASWKERKTIAAALKTVYDAVDDKAAEAALTAFEDGPWGEKYAAIGKAWRRAWQEVIPFFAFPREVRRILYTTNAIEALNSKLRRAVRARGHFPNDEAALKLLFLVLNRAEKDWKMPPREWTAAKAQMAVIFGERFAKAMNA